MNLKELLHLNPRDIDVIIPQDEILTWFDLLDAAWIHNGDPKNPHAELTSGWCSNGFFDCLRVLYTVIFRLIIKPGIWSLTITVLNRGALC